MVGVIVSIARDRRGRSGGSTASTRELREARGLEDHGQTALEAVMTVSAGVAIVGFGVWFFLFSGSSPAPVEPRNLMEAGPRGACASRESTTSP